MTLEELWQLFPIILTEHKDEWATWYAQEQAKLKEALSLGTRIHHIGSTAIKSIWAKPIVDILAEIPKDMDIGALKEPIIAAGYICMSQSENRISFNKGYTEDGFAERVFHLHLRYWGDNDELYFRDYLNDHPDIALEYQALKLSLWKEYEHERDGYTNAKGTFVKECTDQAKRAYKDRYW